MAATSAAHTAAAPSIFSRGFRFDPSPEEAVAYYLPHLLAGGAAKLHKVVRPYIHVTDDVYGSEPDDLKRRFPALPITDVRFFFTTCKCKKGSRAGPAGTSSTWHTGSTVPVKDRAGVKIGEYRKLRHKKNGAYTEWLMDEVSSCIHKQAVVGDKQFVFCKMYVSPRATTTTSSDSTTTHQDSAAAAAAAPGGVVLTQPPQNSFAVPAPNSFVTQAAPKTIFPVPAAPAPAVVRQAAPKNLALPAAYLQAAVPQMPAPRAPMLVKPAATNSFTAPARPCAPAILTQAVSRIYAAPPPTNNSFTAPAPRAPGINMQAAPKSFTVTAPKRPAPQPAVPPCPKRARDAHALPPTALPAVQQQPAAAGSTANRGVMAPASTPLVTPRPPSSSPAPPAQPTARHCPQQLSVQQSSLRKFEAALARLQEGAEEEEESVAAPTPTDPPSEDPLVSFEGDDDDFVKEIEDSLEVIDEGDGDLLAKMQKDHSPALQQVAPTTGCTTASFPAPAPLVQPGRSQALPRRRSQLYKEQLPSFLVSAPRPRAANKGRDRNRMQ